MPRDMFLVPELRILPGDARDAASATVSLLAALEDHDAETGTHTRGVATLAVRIADRLSLSPAQRVEAEHVARLHDVGKLAIPRRILLHPGPLDDLDWAIVREHPVAGAAIVGQIPALAHLVPTVRACHERWDGEGYPDGLQGEQIPLVARITFVCDAYDAMRSDRPYRGALSAPAAAMQVTRGSGTQFCPRSAEALLDVIAQPAGARSDAA